MQLIDTLDEIPMFNHFTESEKKMFAKLEHSLLGFKKDDVIIREGDTFTSLYILIKGTIIITKAEISTPIATLSQGALFGEMSFFTKKPRFSNVIAKDDVLVMKLDKSFFGKVEPEIRDKIKDYLIELLINRLDATNESLSKISKFARVSTLNQ
ncbi:MAG: cyclic nucleotide-binding domain-containing protein [Desulfobacterales bacterium]|nr:cyclic nucleotide-binding domain-containing protein [Deltaproteobacteria bacterium]NNK84596.1 cyclic nucleotide-binding domain-containing protein [Desulfobacterales bacterium]NNL40990.1 cyclic nucleotide-binding domain-containing protein [Desulfobacterales bacterium]